MRVDHYHRVAAIRQQFRAGRTVEQIAAWFDLDEVDVEKILAYRTIEAATQVLDELDSPMVVRCFMQVEGHPVDFTNLIRK